LFLFVDPFERPGAPNANALSLRRAMAWLRSGGVLVVFPAGEVASLDLKTRRVVDPAWSPTIAGLARRTGAPTVPVYIPGRNGALFQAAGLLHPALRTALLPRQLLGSAGRVIELRVGKPIPAARLLECGDDVRAIAYMRGRTEILAAREKPSHLPAAMQPRHPPSAMAPVVRRWTRRPGGEIAALPGGRRLIEIGTTCRSSSRAPGDPERAA
jgi:putative hemolysin